MLSYQIIVSNEQWEHRCFVSLKSTIITFSEAYRIIDPLHDVIIANWAFDARTKDKPWRTLGFALAIIDKVGFKGRFVRGHCIGSYGLDRSDNLAKEFGDLLNGVTPKIDFFPKNPPIEIPSSEKVLLVLHLPQSLNRPHVNPMGRFYHRTNRGNEIMTYTQVKDAFLRYEERRYKLQLFYLELDYNKRIAESIKSVSTKAGGDYYSESYFEYQTIVDLMPDIYPFIHDDETIVSTLFDLRNTLNIANSRIRMLHSQIALPLSNKRDILGS